MLQSVWTPQRCFYPWFLSLLLYLLFIGCTVQTNSGTVHVIPRFTSLPQSVSYFVDGPSQLDLVCRAWPPNAKLYLLASQLPSPASAIDYGTAAQQPARGQLLPLPQGLGHQRFGLLPASHVPTPNELQTPEMLDIINHESLADAIRARPAAAPVDEVAVRLNVASSSEVRQLELMRMHCLVATAYGHMLSPPFRLVPSTLGEFPRSSASDGATRLLVAEFLINNIAIVDCHLPEHSAPKPLVQFELNGTAISESALQNSRFRLVWQPDGRRVSLLIRKVQLQDSGVYRCVATNPLTGERKYSPEATQLKLIIPTSPVETRIVVPLASNSSIDLNGTSNSGRAKEILVEEGQNITLFCIIQGAPPPLVATYPFQQNVTAHERYQEDSKFEGLLHITNVQVKDAALYLCSDRRISSTALLQVKPKLRLVTKPEDVRIRTLGVSVQFKCKTSDPYVTPHWLFNGLVKGNAGSGEENVLNIHNVTTRDLGIYQCVAQRTATKASSDEWVSAFAILALDSDKIIRTPDQLAVYTPQRPNSPVETTSEITTSELTPQAQVLYDNLAVYLIWQSLAPEVSGVDQSKAIEYRLEYSVQVSPNQNDQGNSSETQSMAALVGLIGHEAVRWSEPTSMKQQTPSLFAYVTDTILHPLKRYRFRVIAVDPSTGVSLVPPSDWSNVVSMQHISAAEPPQIKVVQPLSNGRIHLMWTFDDASSGTHKMGSTVVQQPNTPIAAAGPAALSRTANHPIFPLEPDDSTFVPDYFLVLARPIVKPKAQSADSFKYGAYWATQVNGSSSREAMLTGLNRSASYQVIVYGVCGQDDKRQITRFSKAAYVNLATAEYTGGYSILRALTSNRLLYLILGGIAALMILVVFIFILLCICRQQRDRHVTTQRKKQNGFVQNYNESIQYVPVSTTSGPCTGQRQSGAGTLSNHGAGMGMMMNNLQCSAFSDHSASNHGQQQDHYAAAMSKEMMIMQQQQQQQSLMGSQMHLQQQPSGHPPPAYHPQHHQSHHSLLLPSGATPVLPGHGPAAPMFQSGTLPGGPRYVRQPNFAGNQFGSQQPLNRAMTPANAVDMNDYFHHQQQPGVYAHQQPQLPPVPHPQTAELPPPHAVNMNSRQMVYYPGTMTPSGTSMKREPPTGGSFHDGSAYGTLLQRGQLTGSMIHDPSALASGAMSPVNYPNAAYYHGSQQALHMVPNMYPNGMGTPQAAHTGLYSPTQQQQQQQQQAVFFAQQQQQAQQFPGYYGQPLPQHPDGMMHGPHGFGHTDGESIYSYFSQQDATQPNAHQPLNPLPEENQAHVSGYVDSGMQTGDLNGTGAEGSPAGGGSHRHHRRRRRKQQQQQQRQNSDMPNGINGNTTNGSNDAVGEGPPFAQQPGDAQLEEHHPLFEHELPGQKRHHSLSGAGTYSDADPMSGQQSFTSPQSYHHHQQQPGSADPNRNGHMRYDSPQHGQLPPPNQPPPPPPPPAVALGMGSPHPSFMNGYPNEHPNAASSPFPTHPQQQQQMTSDSLSRHIYSGAPGTGNSGTSLMVGPPPRIRDYSEYGIPRGIGLPPTPAGGQPQPPQHNVLMGGNSIGPAQHTNGSMMMYEGRYREGQA